jgi:hypothetical protein
LGLRWCLPEMSTLSLPKGSSLISVLSFEDAVTCRPTLPATQGESLWPLPGTTARMTIPLHSRRTAKPCQFRTPSRSSSPRCSLALVANFSHSSRRVFRDLRTLSFSGSQLSRVLPAGCALFRKKPGVHPYVVIPRLFTVDYRLSAVGQSRATSSISLISPAYGHLPCMSLVSSTYAKTGGGGISSQNSFLRSRLFRLFTKECRRADIFDFSPYILHFSCPERGAEGSAPPARRSPFGHAWGRRRPLQNRRRRPEAAPTKKAGHGSRDTGRASRVTGHSSPACPELSRRVAGHLLPDGVQSGGETRSKQ